MSRSRNRRILMIWKKYVFLTKMELLVNPGLKKISFCPCLNARSSATGVIVRDSLMMLWSVAS